MSSRPQQQTEHRSHTPTSTSRSRNIVAGSKRKRRPNDDGDVEHMRKDRHNDKHQTLLHRDNRSRPMTNHDRTFNFLDLPPEVRNTVYERVLGHVGFKAILTHENIVHVRELLGLAGVNRQLRAEWLPVLRDKMARPFPVHELPTYLDSWVLRFPRAAHNLEIDIARPHEFCIDLYPLLSLCRRNNDITISIISGNSTYDSALSNQALAQATDSQTLLSQQELRIIKIQEFLNMTTTKPSRGSSYNSKKWYTYFGKAVTALDMTFNRNDSFAMQLSKVHTPDWALGNHGKALNQDRQLWLLNTGLCQLKDDGWTITVTGTW